MLNEAALKPRVRDIALSIFERIAVAEAKVHDMPVETVAFHEVGAIDSIVDIVAAAACIEHLGVTRVTASPVPVGHGFTWSQHGRIPVPAPATLLILKGAPLLNSGLDKELVTPTGAGVLAALVDEYTHMPSIKVLEVGMGAGTRRLPDRPNIVRAILGEPVAVAVDESDLDLEQSEDLVIEANIDDMSGELGGHVAALLMAQGALDVWWTPILMKKGRPAHQLSVLTRPEARDALIALVLTETTSLGVRVRPVARFKSRREQLSVETPYGEVMMKVGRIGERVSNVAPEYESARAVAEAAGVPLKRVIQAALAAMDWS